MKTETMKTADGRTFHVETISQAEALRSTERSQDAGTVLVFTDAENGADMWIGSGSTLDEALDDARGQIEDNGLEGAKIGQIYLVADDVDTAAEAVFEAGDLDGLVEALDDLEEACGEHGRRLDEVVDLDTLPTFGGEEPGDTTLVWSWDRRRLLVQDLDTAGYGFSIVDRAGWKAAA